MDRIQTEELNLPQLSPPLVETDPSEYEIELIPNTEIIKANEDGSLIGKI